MSDAYREKFCYSKGGGDEPSSPTRRHSTRSRRGSSRSPLGLKSSDYSSNSPSSTNVAKSGSPKPDSTQQQPKQSTPPVARDSRPDIAAWPAPPPAASILSTKPTGRAASLTASAANSGDRSNAATGPMTASVGTSPIPESHFNATAALEEDSAKLLAMLRSAASLGAGSATGAPSPIGSIHSSSGVAANGGARGREFELRRKIQNLEETVAEYERQKFNVMGTFSEYREYVAERERTLEAEYSNKIIALSEEVLGAKKDFEQRMKSFQALQEQFEHEKEQALENLRQEHQKEIEMLERRVAGSQLLNLEQKYMIEIRRLEEERKSLKTEKERLGETFDMKLRRAQSLYETQLSAAKTLYTKELEALRDHEEHLKEELSARHEEFRDRVQELKLQARQGREEVSTCKTEINLLQKKLKQKESELEFITKELENVRSELRTSMRKLREVDLRYARTTIELNEKQSELNKKAELLEAAESSSSRLESTIRKLQVEVNALKNKVDFLEIERDNLQCQAESQTQLQNSQVQALEAVLESVTKEKETSKEHYEKLLEQERSQAEARESALRKELSAKFNELEEQYNALKDYVDESGAFGPESAKILKEVEVLRAQKNVLEEEVMSLHSQLAEDKQKLDKQPSLNYIIEVLRSVDTLRKNVQTDDGANPSTSTSTLASTSSSTADEKLFDINVDRLRTELQDELAGRSDKTTSDLDLLLRKLSTLDKGLKLLIKEKNEAKCKVAKLEEDNRNMAARLEQNQAIIDSAGAAELNEMKERFETMAQELENERNRCRQLEDQMKNKVETEKRLKDIEEDYTERMNEREKEMKKKTRALEDKLTNAEIEAKKRVEEANSLSESLKASDAKRRLLQEIVEYQQGGRIEDTFEELLCDIGDDPSSLSREELHELFASYEQLRRPEKPPPPKPKPQIREMALQANIEIRPARSASEQLQSEIIGMLTDMMDTNDEDPMEELRALKQALIVAANSAATSSESEASTSNSAATEHSRMPQMCQKAASKLHNLVSQMTERRDKRADKPIKSDSISRSRSPSLLRRLRDRTPSKSRPLESSSANSGSRNTLSTSTEMDRSMESKRRDKRSREAGRPAWKF